MKSHTIGRFLMVLKMLSSIALNFEVNKYLHKKQKRSNLKDRNEIMVP